MLKQKVNISRLKEINKASDITEKDLYENSELIYINNEGIFKAIENLPLKRNRKGDGRKANR